MRLRKRDAFFILLISCLFILNTDTLYNTLRFVRNVFVVIFICRISFAIANICVPILKTPIEDVSVFNILFPKFMFTDKPKKELLSYVIRDFIYLVLTASITWWFMLVRNLVMNTIGG